MKTYTELRKELSEIEVNELIVVFGNLPSKSSMNLLFENIKQIEEGKEKEWGKGFSYRLDRRPENQGGDQLHIFGRGGDAWAYRHTGQKSEPNKYKQAPTSIVKDIVSDIFKIDRDNIEETHIIKATNQQIIIEVVFN